MPDANASSCPKCKAYWIRSATTCRFCGFGPANQGIGPSKFDPDERSGPGADPDASSGVGGSQSKRRLSGVLSLVIAVVVGVGLAGAIAFVASRTILEEDHGNHELSAVCDGEGHSGAAAYGSSGASSGLLVLDRSGSRWNGSDSRPVSEIDLVTCRTQGQKPFRSLGCQARWAQLEDEFRPHSSGSGEIVTFSTDLHRITLEFREARTGTLVATENVAPPVSCPSGDGLLLIDIRNKRHSIVPKAEAEAVVAAYGGSASTSTADDEGTDQ